MVNENSSPQFSAADNQPDHHAEFGQWSTLQAHLLDLSQPLHLSQDNDGNIFLINRGDLTEHGHKKAAFAPALPINALGDNTFLSTHHCSAALYAGSMANGISSPEMVIAMGKHGLLGSYGSGGVAPMEVGTAIQKIQSSLPGGPYAVNLLNSPFEPGLEDQMVDLFIKHQVHTMEASAYLAITRGLLRYRAQGLHLSPDGQIVFHNRIIAKLSRKAFALHFLRPAPEKILPQLIQ
jgi:hypothetical protein